MAVLVINKKKTRQFSTQIILSLEMIYKVP